jgi:hypothetical protein
MAKLEQGKFASKRGLVEGANTLARLLDPHLQSRSKVENVAKEERWPLRKTFLFVGSISLVLWATIFAVIRFLLGL